MYLKTNILIEFDSDKYRTLTETDAADYRLSAKRNEDKKIA